MSSPPCSVGRAAKAQAVAEEWGFSDAKMGALLLKRQERQRKLHRNAEKRKTKQDLMKRLEALLGGGVLALLELQRALQL